MAIIIDSDERNSDVLKMKEALETIKIMNGKYKLILWEVVRDMEEAVRCMKERRVSDDNSIKS
jgi:hypothetical protein